MARRLQHDDDVYECDLDSVVKISTDEEEEEYHEESFFMILMIVRMQMRLLEMNQYSMKKMRMMLNILISLALIKFFILIFF